MASGGLVDIHKTSLVRQSTVLDKRMRSHLGHDMQKIELFLDLFFSVRTSKISRIADAKIELFLDLFFHVRTSKSRRIAVDGNKVVLE